MLRNRKTCNITDVIQHRILECRSRKQKYCVLLRRYGDSFILHSIVVLACLLQFGLYIDAFQHHHSCFTHALFSKTYAGLNIFLFVHYAIDIIVLLLLHFILAPPACGPPDFKSLDCSCCKSGIQNSTANGSLLDIPKVKILDSSNNEHGKHSKIVKNLWSIPIGPFFDIAWSCASVLSGIHDWKTHPLFFFRLMGYAIHHSRIPVSLRVLVAVNKRLFDDGQVVLDMTYITDRVAAMGLPAVGTEALYRNSLDVLATYMRMYHPGSHMIINTCAERVYNKAYFHRLCLFPCKDHEIMPLQRILVFCEIAVSFLSTHSDAIVVVHCMGGKGRTGLMITCWLIYSGVCKSPIDALEYYGRRRTDELLCGKMKSLSNACQIRYLWYFAALCRNRYLGLPQHGMRLRLRRCIFRMTMPSSNPIMQRHLKLLQQHQCPPIMIRIIGLFPPEDIHPSPFQNDKDKNTMWDYLEESHSFEESLIHCEQNDASNRTTSSPTTLDILSNRPFKTMSSSVTGSTIWHIEDIGHTTQPCVSAKSHTQACRIPSPTSIIMDWSPFSKCDQENSVLSIPPNELIHYSMNGAFDIQSEENLHYPFKNEVLQYPIRCNSNITVGHPTLHDIEDEFGIELCIHKKNSVNPLESHYKSYGQIWLHPHYLHVGLPSDNILAEARRLDKPYLFRNTFSSNESLSSIHQPLPSATDVTPFYKECIENNQRRLIVSYTMRDVDFINKQLRNEMATCHPIILCVFDIM